MNEEFKSIIPEEKNSLKKDIFFSFRSNSHNHYKDISNYNYEHRIKLDPLGEGKSMDIRQQVPLSHIHDYFIKSNYKKNKDYKNAYERADIQSKINYHLKKQKHQNLLNKEKFINKTCQNKNKELKKSFELKKHKLKDKLTVIIKDALRFSTKNSAVRAMLPDNINEIVEKAKKVADKVCVIGRTNYFGSHQRNTSGIWKNLIYIYIFDRQVSYEKKYTDDLVNCGCLVTAWFIYDKNYDGLPMIKIIDVDKYVRRKKLKKC